MEGWSSISEENESMIGCPARGNRGAILLPLLRKRVKIFSICSVKAEMVVVALQPGYLFT